MIPCEGEQKTIVFATRSDRPFLSIIEGTESMELFELISMEYQENQYVFEGPTPFCRTGV